MLEKIELINTFSFSTRNPYHFLFIDRRQIENIITDADVKINLD